MPYIHYQASMIGRAMLLVFNPIISQPISLPWLVESTHKKLGMFHPMIRKSSPTVVKSVSRTGGASKRSDEPEGPESLRMKNEHIS